MIGLPDLFALSPQKKELLFGSLVLLEFLGAYLLLRFGSNGR